MKTTSNTIVRSFASFADPSLKKVASMSKEARRRWLEDADLVKLCKLCKTPKHQVKK
jgi:hypothetical protein